MVDISRKDTLILEKTISYLEAGPQDAPLLIFVHGWPAIADVWKPQILTFAGLGFRVVAPDLPGFGKSFKSDNKKDFSLKWVNTILLRFLKHLGRTQAIWIGHDWGAGVVWSLLSHYPENCIGVANMCIAYRTIECGVQEGLIKHADRELYPEDQYPNAQWDYMVYYQDEKNFDKCIRDFESDIPNFFRVVYRKGDPETLNTPTFTASITKNNGWFGEEGKPPELPLDTDVLNQETHAKLVEAFQESGFRSPTSYYLNMEDNAQYTEDWQINEGLVNLPVLFIGAKYDSVAMTAKKSKATEQMRNFCRKFTQVNIAGGHWIAQEKPEEVNAAIAKWIATALPASVWPAPQPES
ncbi:uncharacterized protein A1O9_07706 [Exophiala aquamarina CBS 119918]|uniref:AB hydrolase-1 domain-containing protein n=1 Tax=Exophiala aquamarina CBS 119918 TaxID=1182545 RepID=A0A072PKT1_9EURO|nr:uncharacterized protein A1O9_07706 [Exophiala aquamarina CBS 119918]KEF56125.1 hypothetical protein A1O9_07706 [Exophiala aquamarina CBS 119918]